MPDVTGRDTFLCGSAGPTSAVGAVLRSLGVPDRRIHGEALETS